MDRCNLYKGVFKRRFLSQNIENVMAKSKFGVTISNLVLNSLSLIMVTKRTFALFSFEANYDKKIRK